MRFSSLANQLPAKLNRLYSEYDRARASGKAIIDLISANLTEQGPGYPTERLQAILQKSADQAQTYRPDPLGQRTAREAIAAYYKSAATPVSAHQVLITPGTSVSYLYCFKLLASPQEEILCPSPSYPLFETIAQLCDVKVRYYRLRESQSWEIDLDYLESQISTVTRALVLISPHNPTGMVASIESLDRLAEIADRHSLPIIADEVFSEFLYGLDALPRPASTSAPLVFTLNGFSKMFALPGLKLGWVVVSGRESWVRQSLEVLELISDTFLPVNDIAQYAVAGIFETRAEFHARHYPWVVRCREIANQILSQCPDLRFTSPQGGFYLTMNLDDPNLDEEEFCLDVLRGEGILLHPGYFYDMAPAHLVLTYIVQPERLSRALRTLTEQITRWKSLQGSFRKGPGPPGA